MPDRPVNRRGFFTSGLRELLSSVTKSAEPIARALEQFAPPAEPAPPPTEPSVLRRKDRNDFESLPLRPPGALLETQFLSTCTRCGRCAEVCPAQCIRLDASGKVGDGAPHIDANIIPCVVCESLACMNTCPSGALKPIPMVDIDMGTAVWHEETCIRSTGEECRVCAEKCPLGTAAIDIVGREVVVKPLGCIGCGICQHECPTSPKSILVIPAAARQRT